MSDFVPTAGQAEALEGIRSLPQRFPAGGGLMVVSGPAGTGKTSLLRVLAKENPLLFVLTPTGKAAERVKQSAGCDALTIHRWQYTPIKDEDTGDYSFSLKDPKTLILPPNKTLIVDEASMLSEQLYHHLSFFARSLALNLVLIGDGFQLPPVERDLAKKSFSVFDLPADIKVNLTEVLRQALENPIIQIGTAIRTSPNIMSTVLSLPVIPSAEVDRALLQNLEEGGVVICHSNKMRQELNARIRTLKSLPEDILREGEPLLVTKNNYDLDLFNGEILTVAELGRQYRRFPVTDRRKNKSLFMEFQHVVFHDIEAKAEAIISPQEVFGKAVALDPDAIRHGSILCMAREHPSIEKEKRPKHLHATLGYAITAHKSQGSEWPSVLVVVEDSVKLSTQEGRRWLYTAITRSKDKVAVIWP